MSLSMLQGSLFGDGPDRMPVPQPRSCLPDPADVRRRLNALLAKARAAERMPWPEQKARMWRTVFPQMANWLPKDEAAELRAAFACELARLDAKAVQQ